MLVLLLLCNLLTFQAACLIRAILSLIILFFRICLLKNWLDSMFSRRLFIGHLNVFAGGIHMFESQWNDVFRILYTFFVCVFAFGLFSCADSDLVAEHCRSIQCGHCHINHLCKMFIIHIIENMLCFAENWSLNWNLWPNSLCVY